MLDRYELNDYISKQLDQGQLIDVLTDHLIEHTDALLFIVTKHNGFTMNISRAKKYTLVKNYIEDVQKYG